MNAEKIYLLFSPVQTTGLIDAICSGDEKNDDDDWWDWDSDDVSN